MRTWIRWLVKINKTTMYIIFYWPLQWRTPTWKRSIVIGPCVQLIKILKQKFVRMYQFFFKDKITFSNSGHCEQSNLATGFSDGSKTKCELPWISPKDFLDFFPLGFSPKTSKKFTCVQVSHLSFLV